MSDNTTESERYFKTSDLQKEAEKRYPLWEFFAEEHDLTLTEGELDDVINAVKKHLANDNSNN